MLTMPNGDRWAYISEFDVFPPGAERNAAYRSGRTPETHTLREVVTDIATGRYPPPCKWTVSAERPTGWWSTGGDEFEEVVAASAVRSVRTPMMDVCEMPWGELVVRYDKGADCNWERRFETYPD